MLKQKTKYLLKNIKTCLLKVPIKIWFILLALLMVLFVAVCYVLCFIMPQRIIFTYAENRYCINKITLLPNLHKQSGDPNFKLQVEGGSKLGNLYLFSDKTCIDAVALPTDGDKTINFSPFGGLIFRTNYIIHVGSSPKISTSPNKPIALKKSITFKLDQPDNISAYQLEINKKTSKCNSKSNIISCSIETLELKQGESYSYKLARSFNNVRISDVIKGNLSLLPPAKVTKTSIQANEVIYSKPRSFTFETDKKLITATVTLEKINTNEPIKVKSTDKITESIIETSIENDLERGIKYRLTLVSAEAEDGSTLDTPYIIEFLTSGGPTVTGININTSNVDANAKVIVTFDQALSQTQDLSKIVSFSGGTATIGRTNNQITFQLSNLPRCSVFSISIKKGLSSQYGIGSKDDWSYTSRTNCRATEVIGYSVNGRPIIAYFYGSGPTTILFTGGIHGNEPSGKYIMQDWISYLDANAYKIPADRQIVIVPSVNPDGLAAYTRYNAHNVNIGANFAAANWQSDIDSGGGIVVGGGGAYAMSEPETNALANLTTRLRPRLEISFHASGSLVGANQRGDSVAIGNLYASSVGYTSMIGSAEAVMGYRITGEYEEWAGEQYGTPAILIELPSSTGYYFWSNQTTLWKMISL